MMLDSKNKFLSRWLPLIIFILFFSFSTSAQCPCTDCRCTDSLALVALYDSTNGSNWTNKWVLTQPMTTWFGVTLTNGRVTCIDLDGAPGCSSGIMNGNNLVGKIPIKLTELTQLTGLILTRNKLTGSIPNFNFPNLTQLILRDNQLSGTIPNFNLPKLGTLFLSNNLLSGNIPNFNFPNLTQLFLGQNQLTGNIPNFNLPNLIDLNLSPNQLTGAIPNFNFPNLQYLTLINNQLSGNIPNFNFPNLINLNLSQNQLTGTIPNFNFLNLTDLNLSQNQLTGTIPNFNLPNLTQLILGPNQLSGTIPNFNFPSLKTFYLSNNQLSGCLPSGLRSLCSHVTSGNISSNPNLSTQDWAAFCANGTGECGSCTPTTTLEVSNLTKTGATIAWFAVTGATSYKIEYKTAAATTWTSMTTITSLTTTLAGLLEGTIYNVRVITNCASGSSIPSFSVTYTTLGRAFPVGLPTCLEDDFRELEKLYDATNGNNWTDKTGWFSANMASWKGIFLTPDGCDVKTITLPTNNLIGTIPNFNLPNLTALILNGNQLSGSIPNFNLPELQTMILGDNKLTGTIPNFNCPKLQFLSLLNNQLSGTIPNFNFPDLQRLLLNQNQLTGTIPNFNFPLLIDLIVNNNLLNGAIPNFNLPKLEYLNLAQNKLTGTIPNFNFPNLKNLHLTDNQLNGVIPNFNYPNLLNLALGQNQLSGAIPNFNLPNLTLLILFQNQLTGTIPNFNLPVLKNLHLGQNQLSGCLPSGLRSLCSHVTIGDISSNPNLATQSWTAFCANGTGECITCAAPATPSVSNVTNTGVTINWVAVANAIDYTVEYKTAAATNWTVLTPINALTTSLTGLLQGTTYNVRITTNCTSGTSTPSVFATFTTLGRAFPVGLPTCLEDDFRELEKLYDATNGNNWTDKTGWFSANMASWKGINLTANGCDVKDIYLNTNNLIGTIPSFNLPNLQVLNLYQNQLNGTIPNFNLPNLLELHLGNNQLNGTIPNFNLPNLKTLTLFTNQLSGTIPNFNLINLIGLLLSSNQLTGTIPNFNLPNLKSLWLSFNQLNGTIPNFDLPNVQDLLLNQNQLSGTIPNFNLQNLQNLALSFNQLSGTIPNFNLPNLQRLSLQNNKLEGILPKFSSLNKLETLSINDNLLDSLPNLSALPLKKDTTSYQRGLRCFSNALTFDDLLPNIGFLTSAMFMYTPQDTIAKNITSFSTNIGSTLTIDLGIDAGLSSNKYVWFKNSIRFDSSNQNKLILRGVTSCDAGTYKVQVTNPNVPALTLFSRDIKVIVTGTLPTQRTDTAICAGQTYTLPNGKVVSIATNFKDTLKNRYGCDSLIRVVNLSINALPTSNVQDVAICAGKTYTLPNGRVVNTATNFRDTLKNSNGCDSLIRVVNLSINPLPVPDVRDVTICPNETATLQIRNTPNNYRIFQWQNNTSTTTTASYTPPLSSTYKVTVTDINGCQGIATANIMVKSASDTSCITVIPKPKAVNDNFTLELNQTKLNFNVTPNDIFDHNLNWKISVQESPTQGVLTDLGKGAFLYEATPNQRGVVTFKYRLCTIFRSIDYCDSATVTINVLGRDKRLPPDAITPNGDGKNDRFIIPDLEGNPTKYPNNELLILNRWGQVLYQAKPYKNDWEGTNQQNLPLPDGTYYYIMRLSIADGKILTGDLLIVRD